MIPSLEPAAYLVHFLAAYALTLLIETTALFAVLALPGRRFQPMLVIRNSLIANTATLPVVWFIFPWLVGPAFGYAYQIAVSELFAFGAEAAIYQRLFPGRGLAFSLRDAALASFICNLASFLAGVILF
jgi:hypothetical protein